MKINIKTKRAKKEYEISQVGKIFMIILYIIFMIIIAIPFSILAIIAYIYALFSGKKEVNLFFTEFKFA